MLLNSPVLLNKKNSTYQLCEFFFSGHKKHAIMITFFFLFLFSHIVNIGVLQDMFEQIFKEESNIQLKLSFAGTIMEAMVNLMGPVAQIILARYGINVLLGTGSFLSILGLMMAGFTTEFWHLYLCQGVVFGAGASLLYCCVLNTVPQWFDKKKGLAVGLFSSGSGAGGLILPFILNAVNHTLGVGWSYRILGFIVMLCCVFACALVKERVKRERTNKPIRELFDFSMLKDITYVLWLIGSLISLMGFFVPYFFLPSYTRHIGLTPEQGTALVAVMSAANFVGRIFIGYTADRIGLLNADIIFRTMCGLSSFLIWTFAYDYGVLMAFCVVFGLFCGSYFTLCSPITLDIVGPEKFSTGLSMVIMGNVISVFGPSIASAIQTEIGEPYFVYKIFTGTVYIVGAIILIFCKYKRAKFWSKI
ncbi:unnamed protein product [Cunninghamella blakesleeana]